MSGLPPPVPAAEAVPRRPGASFVTVLAWVSLVAGGLGVMYSVVQLLTGLFVPDFQMQMLNPTGAALPPLPPMMHWIYANTVSLALGSLLMSAALVAVARGLLHRREWARLGFIALLVLGTLWQLGMVWMVPQIIEGTLAVQMAVLPPGELDELGGFMESMTTMFTVVAAVVVLVFTALHAWIVWKLYTAEVRAEFDH